jgi:ornithine cyclodeaminase
MADEFGNSMCIIDAAQVRELVSMSELVDSLAVTFGNPATTSPRQIARIPGGHGDRLLLSMPAFDATGAGIVKLATVFPDNKGNSPTIQGVIIIFSDSGKPIAIIDAPSVTRMRTGATSALASRYLSRENSSHLLLVGTGALAPAMVAGHAAVRPVRRVSVWGLRRERVDAAITEIRDWVGSAIELTPCDDLQSAVAAADIACCATSSPEPVILGDWIRPGTHVDLVGSFSPKKREADDETVRRARLFVDTFEGALTEAGDLLQPLGRGIIQRSSIEAELADLVSGRAQGRRDPAEITLFKSVGTAIEDLAASRLVLKRLR